MYYCAIVVGTGKVFYGSIKSRDEFYESFWSMKNFLTLFVVLIVWRGKESSVEILRLIRILLMIGAFEKG